MKKSFKAFTFFEILIGFCIVAFIVSIVFIGLHSTRAKARDAGRISDLNQLKTLLQLYYMDNDSYPISPTSSENVRIWCSLEETEGDDECAMFAEEFHSKLKPYSDIIPGDPFYPKEESGEKYSYQYKSSSIGSEYKIRAFLETKEPFEVYSTRGLAIGYFNPDAPSDDEEPAPPPGSYRPRPPTVWTYFPDPLPAGSAIVDGTEIWLLNGEITALGSGGPAIERGFEWYIGESSEGQWTETGEFLQESFSYIKIFDLPPSGTCADYLYRAMALDSEGGWGYGEKFHVEFCVTDESEPETTPY